MEEPHSIQDAELISNSKRGDKEAFGLLYERYAGSLFRYIYAHLDSRQDAEDLTEEVFWIVWQMIKSYNDQGYPFQAFLFKIGKNKLIDHYRRRKTVGNISDFLKDEFAADPEMTYEQNMDHTELQFILAKLSKDYREVLILRFLNGLSPQEVSSVMHRSEEAIRVLQHRALKATRKLLSNGDRHE